MKSGSRKGDGRLGGIRRSLNVISAKINPLLIKIVDSFLFHKRKDGKNYSLFFFDKLFFPPRAGKESVIVVTKLWTSITGPQIHPSHFCCRA
jgi:hypothetical protein